MQIELSDNRIKSMLNDPRFTQELPGLKQTFANNTVTAGCGSCNQKPSGSTNGAINAVRKYIASLGPIARNKIKTLLGADSIRMAYRNNSGTKIVVEW